MCGIAGILRVWQPGEAPPAHAEAIPEAWLDILDESIKNRGPDGRGRFRQRVVRGDGSVVDVALVHRRLSIIDHADGAQPMLIGECATGGSPASAAPLAMISREGAPYAQLPTAADHYTCPKCGDGVVAVVFNGCIYNHRELRRELEAAGHVFRSDHSDTEVLLHGWREWGERGLDRRLDGMFAYLLWDPHIGRVIASRDTFGEKALYRMQLAEQVMGWSSVPAGLFALGRRTGGAATCDIKVRTWLRFGWDRRTLGAGGLFEVPCVGRAETSSDGAPADGGFGLPRWLDRAGQGNSTLTIETADTLLADAVASRLEADVPVGCFLSGGIDSSLIAAYASRAEPALQCFTVAMPDPRFDEAATASRVARHLGVRHTVLDCQANPAADTVEIITQFGLPFGDSSILPTTWVCRATRSVVPVALAGDGGDELFGGYERHTIDPADPRLRAIARLAPSRMFPSRDPRSRSAKGRRLFQAMRLGPGSVAPELAAIFPARDLAMLLDHESSRLNQLPDELGAAARRSSSIRLFDLDRYLPGDLLRKSDTASMGAALELRAPFLAARLAAAAIGTPINTLMPHGQRKGLLRAIARRYLPAEIVDRPKMGFAIPIGEWFRTDYGGMRQLLYDHLEAPDPFPGRIFTRGPRNRAELRQKHRGHRAAGERSINPWHGRDHSQRLYMLLVLSIWCRWLRGL